MGLTSCLLVGLISPVVLADTPQTAQIEHAEPLHVEASREQQPHPIAELCQEVGSTLGSVSVQDCLQQNLNDSSARSVKGRAIAIKEYGPTESRQPLGRVLLMGGIHGDEYSSVTLLFRWMEKLNQYHSGLFHWQVVPLLNPDGLLNEPRATRQNGNGVDLNRNFPSQDWDELAQHYWEEKTYRNPRRYPGPQAASEPETQWFVQLIEDFQPDAIIAVHAPHHLVDYDGPQSPPIKLGVLQLRRLGIYPGSLGNYGGISLQTPVVTVELPSAGSMPSDAEISRMWVDLVRWLRREVPKQKASREKQEAASQLQKASSKPKKASGDSKKVSGESKKTEQPQTTQQTEAGAHSQTSNL